VITEAAINGVTSKARNPHGPCVPAELGRPNATGVTVARLLGLPRGVE